MLLIPNNRASRFGAGPVCCPPGRSMVSRHIPLLGRHFTAHSEVPWLRPAPVRSNMRALGGGPKSHGAHLVNRSYTIGV